MHHIIRLAVPGQVESPILAASLRGCGWEGRSVAQWLYNTNGLVEKMKHTLS